MKVLFSEDAWDDYLYWQRTDRKLLERVNALIKDAQRSPFSGRGEPEPLKQRLQGYWSRWVNDEHRMVYMVGSSAEFVGRNRAHPANAYLGEGAPRGWCYQWTRP